MALKIGAQSASTPTTHPPLPGEALPGGDTARSDAAVGQDIRIDQVSLKFNGPAILENFDLQVPAGQFLCILGPSGCGKSTLLNIMAGFLQPSTGTASVAGKQITGPGFERGVVFQSPEALFPWLTVRANVAFGARMRRLRGKDVERAIDESIEKVGLQRVADRFVGELSGGMRQRVQIARVFVTSPPVVLMDEPFGSLDAQTREVMQQELENIWRETRPTVIFITHDIQESIQLGDRIITMTAGPAGRVKGDYMVDAPRPRDVLSSPLRDLHTTLRDDIREEVRRTFEKEVG